MLDDVARASNLRFVLGLFRVAYPKAMIGFRIVLRR